MLPEECLVRFVIAPDHTVVPDIIHALPGEALWLSCTYDVVEQAVARGVFCSLDSGAVANQLPDKVETLLRKYCLDLLAMAKKSGILTAGYEKVRAAEASNQVALLLRAGDSAFNAKEKLSSHHTAMPVTLFSSDELSSVIGRQHVVHMALKSGKLTAKLRIAIKRLTNYKR